MRPTCIRCEEAEAPPLGFCPECAVAARTEVNEGVKRFCQYLTAWAAFDEWLRRSGLEPL